MKTLSEKFVDYCVACGVPPEADYGFKLTARPHFIAGAAAMAELLATNNEPLVQEIAKWREMTTALLPYLMHRGSVGAGG